MEEEPSGKASDAGASVSQADASGEAKAQGSAPQVSLATHHVMQANRSKDTGPELAVRRALRAAGLTGYRKHWKKAPGTPDVCFVGRKVAIFVNGCYWHRCPHCMRSTPKTNVDFWTRKFARNRARDERNERLLVGQGWTVLVVWECALKKGRIEATMREVVRQVELAGDARTHVARVVDVGQGHAWKARARARWHAGRAR